MSSPSSIPLWGQAWELVVRYATANGGAEETTITINAFEPEALRMTFDVQQRIVDSPWWSADISIYNLNQQSVQNTLYNATWATLKAGFQTGNNMYSTIWDGPVFQVLYDRPGVVDQCVTLRCIASPLLCDEIVSFAVGPYSSQLDYINQMAELINVPQFSASSVPGRPAAGNLGQKASQLMSAKAFPRGNTCFGNVAKYLSLVADDNFMQKWHDGRQAYITEVSRDSYTPDVLYAPPYPPDSPFNTPIPGVTQSILGTPRQTPFGVIFNVLLDPRLKVTLPPMVVGIQQALISQLAVIPSPGSSAFTPFGNNLKFVVAQVRHAGDTRGNDWYTEVVGFNTTYAEQLLDGVFAASTGGG